MRTEDSHVTISIRDTFTPEIRRVRYKLLTPIGRLIPPRGSIHRQLLMFQVACRRLGRVLYRDVPGASAVPWPVVRERWGRWLERLGTAYILVVLLALLLYLASRLIGG